MFEVAVMSEPPSTHISISLRVLANVKTHSVRSEMFIVSDREEDGAVKRGGNNLSIETQVKFRSS